MRGRPYSVAPHMQTDVIQVDEAARVCMELADPALRLPLDDRYAQWTEEVDACPLSLKNRQDLRILIVTGEANVSSPVQLRRSGPRLLGRGKKPARCRLVLARLLKNPTF